MWRSGSPASGAVDPTLLSRRELPHVLALPPSNTAQLIVNGKLINTLADCPGQWEFFEVPCSSGGAPHFVELELRTMRIFADRLEVEPTMGFADVGSSYTWSSADCGGPACEFELRVRPNLERRQGSAGHAASLRPRPAECARGLRDKLATSLDTAAADECARHRSH